MDIRSFSPLLVAGAALAFLLPSVPPVTGGAPSALGEPEASLARATCTLTVSQSVLTSPDSAQVRSALVVSDQSYPIEPQAAGTNGLTVVEGTAVIPEDETTGECPETVSGRLIVAQAGVAPLSLPFSTPARPALPLLDPKGDDSRTEWLYGLAALSGLAVLGFLWARQPNVKQFENPNLHADKLSRVQVLSGAKWTFPGSLGTTLSAVTGITTAITAAKLLEKPQLLAAGSYSAHVLVLGILLAVASAVFNAASTPVPVKSSKPVPEEAERARTTPVWALYLANALLTAGTTGLLLLAGLLVLDFHLAGLVPLWLASIAALLIVLTALGLAIYSILYTRRMVREQGYQLRGFGSIQAAANWGIDPGTPRRLLPDREAAPVGVEKDSLVRPAETDTAAPSAEDEKVRRFIEDSRQEPGL